MTLRNNNEVKNIAECNLPHDIINTPKRAKNLNSHYSPILHGCMNTRKVRSKFKNFPVLLESGFSSNILMVGLVKKLAPEKDALMQWHTQAINITTNLKFKVDFNLPTLSATNILTWNCHVGEYSKSRYDMILGRYLLIELLLNLKFSEHVIEADDGPFKGSTTPMVNLGKYIFKYLNTGKFTPEE